MIEPVTDSTTRAVVTIVDFLYANWDRLLYTFIIVAIAFALIWALRKVSTKVGEERGLSPGTVGFINGIIKYGILIFAAINVLGVFSFTYVYSLILSLGLVSVVIALGSQTIISNLMGGIIVYVERPFLAGDVIRVGDNTGEVLGISFRSSTLRGLNGLNITIPNSTFLTAPIVNFTRTRSYLLKVPFVLPRAADASKLVDAVRQHLSLMPGVRSDLEMHAYKSRMTPDSIDYEFHVWVKDPRDSETTASAVIDVVDGLFKSPQEDVR